MNKDEIIEAISNIGEDIIAEQAAIRFSRMNAQHKLKRKNILRFSSIAASICLFIGTSISIAYMEKYYDPSSDPSLSTDSTDGVQVGSESTSITLPDMGDSLKHVLSINSDLIIDGEKLTKEDIENTLVKEDTFIKKVLAECVREGFIEKGDLFVADAIVSRVSVKGEKNRISQHYAFLPIVNKKGDIVARIEFLKNKGEVFINISCEPREEILNQLLKEYPNQDIIIVGVTDGLASELAITPDGVIHLVGGAIPEYDPDVFYYDYYNIGVNILSSKTIQNSTRILIYTETEGYQ